MAQEDVQLAGVQPLRGLVVDREVENDETVVLVLVHLRPLALREDILDVERVPAEALGERRRLLRRRGVEVDPGQAVSGELSRLARRGCRNLASDVARASPDAGQAGHRY